MKRFFSPTRMLKFGVGLLIFSSAQWPVAYLLDIANKVWYVTGLSILALQFAAVGAIAGASETTDKDQNG